MQNPHKKKRISVSRFRKGLRLIIGALEAFLLLPLEVLLHPRWLPHRFRGYVHRYFLNRFHVSRVSEYEAHTRSVYDAFIFITGRNETQVREACANNPAEILLDLQLSIQDNEAWSPILSRYDSTSELATVIYTACKLLQPKMVVETGVARGATTAMILKALNENGIGHLHSVDLPALSWGYKKHIGELVPRDLQSCWSLRLGPTSHVLSNLLRDLDMIDIFIHDSAHSYHPQKMDYELALAYLSPGGILISDDVKNNAFIEVAETHDCRWSIIWQPKANPIGILSKGPCD